MIGFWQDAELPLCEVWEMDERMQTLLVPGRTVPMTIEFAAEERVPCRDEETALRCVRLAMASFPMRTPWPR